VPLKWKIYYEEGPEYSSLDGPPEMAPKRGVQAVICADKDHGHRVERANDFYVWWYGDWRGVDIFGLWDYLSQPGNKIVLFGRLIPYEEYRTILAKAMTDPEIPDKTGYQAHERK